MKPKAPTPPDKDEQTPLSEESLRDKVQKLVFNDKYELTDVQSIKLRDSLVKLIIAERQAWGEQAINRLIVKERLEALEQVGAIGADYSDDQDTDYRNAVEAYIIEQRGELEQSLKEEKL